MGRLPVLIHMSRLVLLALLASCGDDGVHTLPDAPPLPPDAAVSPPLIVTPPQDLTVIAGTAASFTVVAQGPGPLTFQWARGGAGIAGATSEVYSIGTTAIADDGAMFSVRVCSGPQQDGACVESAPAKLTVLPANTLTAIQIAAGYETNVVVRPDGTVWAWGGLYGVDGTYNTAVSASQIAKRPVRIYPAALVDVAQVSIWYDGFWALRGTPGSTASRVLHWGRARDGSDGRGTDGAGSITGTVPQFRDNFAVPVEVLERSSGVPLPIDRVCSIAGGASALLMIRAVDGTGVTTSCAAGAVKTAWLVGSLTSFPAQSTGVAAPVPGLPTDSPPALVFAGATESGTPPWFIGLEDGRLFAFGANNYNGLGLSVPAASEVGSTAGPLLLPAAWGNVRSVATSFYYSLFAVDAAGNVRTSGYASDDELGRGDLAKGEIVNGPVPVYAESCTAAPCATMLTGVSAITTSRDNVTLALKNGRLLGWGNGGTGLLGANLSVGQTQPFPRLVPTPLTGITALSSAGGHALVLGPARAVYAWGNGLRGALGDGADTAHRDAPGLVLVP